MVIPLLDVIANTTPPGIWPQNGSILGIVIVVVVVIVAAIIILGLITNHRTRNGSHRKDSSVDGGKS